ncbi:MAG: outer membrane protein OmpA-like peptidoglycan-associated protein [Bacteroidia bacterium]|jgi:outer membrane protein OmpA-like peptidoglycan-associated protein
MNKKYYHIGVLISICLFGLDSFAQNYMHKFGVEISGGLREYGGDRGTRYFLAEKPEYNAVGGSFGYYINSSFDATIYGSYGTLGHRDDSYPVKLGFTAQVTDVMLGLRFKFNNGSIIREDARVKPFLMAGYGGMQSVSKIIHNIPGYGQNRTWFAAQWSAGGGVRIGITDAIDLSLQSLYNYTYDDNYDGMPFSLSKVRLSALHDAYLYHTAGLVFNFGDGNGWVKPGSKEEEVPEEIVAKVKLAARNINFETASATILEESYSDLDSIVDILKAYPTIDALVEGHTDDVGDDNSNMTLSQQRAQAVKEYLISKGIDPQRLTANGYGETQPISKNNTPEGRAENRRVEVKLFYRK